MIRSSVEGASDQRRANRIERLIVSAMLVIGVGIGVGILQMYRAGGGQPRFYQENFGPAVMMACGHGFVMPAGAPVKSLQAFLLLERDTFDCADLTANPPTQEVTWNGTWYYIYGTTAAIWKITGLSWRALDWLAGVFVGVSLATLYALFRLVSGRALSIAVALLLTLLPVNLVQMSALRDFSKVPFALLCVYVLARLVMRLASTRETLAWSAAFGAIVGFGYGFRTDLMIMAPFGFVVIALLLPGHWRQYWRRNVAAVAVAAVTFAVVATPPLRGLRTGGCQFHYSLLGLTDPMTDGLGVQNGLYSFGGHFLDSFVDLKVGDRAARVEGMTIPNLCDPGYDQASGALFFDFARTFPADLITRAYGAVLVVLQSGMQVPDLYGPLTNIPVLVHALQVIKSRPDVMGLVGPLVTFAAVCVAWTASARLGIALTMFVLFLTGYPAIEFESRHWFHLRFIPWWGALLLVSVAFSHREALRDHATLLRGLVPTVVTISLMALSLFVARMYQHRAAAVLVNDYLSAAVEPVASTPRQDGGLDLAWQPHDFAVEPHHRATDMLVLKVDGGACAAPGSVDVRFAYVRDNPAHNMTSTVSVRRDASGPTTVFMPIYMQGFLDQTYMRFSHLEFPGGAAGCVSSVGRFADRRAIPLWLEFQAPPRWQEGPLHMSLRTPWPLRWLTQ